MDLTIELVRNKFNTCLRDVLAAIKIPSPPKKVTPKKTRTSVAAAKKGTILKDPVPHRTRAGSNNVFVGNVRRSR